jgi:hypothetical protein
MLDPSKVIGGSTKVGSGKSIIQLQDPNLVKDYPDLFGSMDTAYNNDPESITITTFETALPQFVFAELYECQRKFFDVIKADDRKGRVERHSHKSFIHLEEPFGSTSQVPDEELADFVNLLQHIGVLRIEDNKWVMYKQSPFNDSDNRYLYFPDDRPEAQSMPLDLRRLHIDDFAALLNQNNTWFTHFAELFRKRLMVVFKSGVNAESYDYLKRYFKSNEPAKGFPYIPEILISYIKSYSTNPRDPDHEELVRFVTNNSEDNTYKAAMFKNEQPEKNRICRSLDELGQMFDEWDNAHFERSGKSIVVQTKGTEQQPPAILPKDAVIAINDFGQRRQLKGNTKADTIKYLSGLSGSERKNVKLWFAGVKEKGGIPWEEIPEIRECISPPDVFQDEPPDPFTDAPKGK